MDKQEALDKDNNILCGSPTLKLSASQTIGAHYPTWRIIQKQGSLEGISRE